MYKKYFLREIRKNFFDCSKAQKAYGVCQFGDCQTVAKGEGKGHWVVKKECMIALCLTKEMDYP